MVLFSDYVAWQNYAATDFVEAEVAEARAEAHQRYVEAVAMMAGPATTTVTKAKASIATQTEVEAARDAVIAAYARRKLTGVVYANIDRIVNLLSRELSRRIASTPNERRSNRWNP